MIDISAWTIGLVILAPAFVGIAIAIILDAERRIIGYPWPKRQNDCALGRRIAAKQILFGRTPLISNDVLDLLDYIDADNDHAV